MTTEPMSASELEREAIRLLRRIGITGEYLAQPYLVQILKLMYQSDDPRCSAKCLYLDTARRYNTSIICVERNIRTAAEVAYRTEHHEELDRIAGAPLHRRPSNKQLIDILFYHLTCCH